MGELILKMYHKLLWIGTGWTTKPGIYKIIRKCKNEIRSVIVMGYVFMKDVNPMSIQLTFKQNNWSWPKRLIELKFIQDV